MTYTAQTQSLKIWTIIGIWEVFKIKYGMFHTMVWAKRSDIVINQFECSGIFLSLGIALLTVA